MPVKTINRLTNVETLEVSLVKRGANNKRIALTKSERIMDFAELLKSVLETEAEGEEELVKTLKASGADTDAISAATASFRLQNGFRDKLSKEHFEAVAKAAGYEVGKAKEEEKEEDEKPAFPGAAKPFKSKAKAKAKDEEEKTKKSHTPAEMPAEMQAVFKVQQGELETLRKEHEETTEILKAERTERIRKEYVAKCASHYTHVPGMGDEEMGAMLQKAYDVSEEFGVQLEKQWEQTNEAVKASVLLTKQGVLAANAGSAGAWSKMTSMAKERLAKSADMTQEQALDTVISENPELYAEYLDDNPSQTGKR